MARILIPERPKVLKMLLYGLGGSGKTTFCASALEDSRTFPVLWIDMAGNPEAATDTFLKYPEKATILSLDLAPELGKVYDYLSTGQSTANSWAKLYSLKGGYKTVVIDTITEGSRKIISRLLGVDKFDVIPTISKESEKLMMQHYGTVLNWTMSMGFSFLNGLPDMNVIITSQEKVSEWSTANRPALYGQAVTELPGYAKLVARLTSKEATKDLQSIIAISKIPREQIFNVLQIKPSADVDLVNIKYGLDISKSVARDVVNPTITKLFDLLQIGK